jgi:hypothetical protein
MQKEGPAHAMSVVICSVAGPKSKVMLGFSVSSAPMFNGPTERRTKFPFQSLSHHHENQSIGAIGLLLFFDAWYE